MMRFLGWAFRTARARVTTMAVGVLFAASQAAAQQRVELELVLAIDASTCIDADEYDS